MRRLYFLFLPALIILHVIFLIIIRFTAWPEMLSYPYFVNNGFTLYKDFVHPYPPLLTLGLAFIYKIYDYNELILKIVTGVLIILNDILILKIVKKITGSDIFAVAAVALYVFTQPFLEGNQLWFDLAIVTPILSGTYFLLRGEKYKNILLSGIFFGIAALIKQTSGLFLILGFVYTLITIRNFKKVLTFTTGPIILGALLLVYLILTNSVVDFAKWNLFYPFTFWSRFPGYVEMSLTTGQMVVVGVLLFPIFFTIAQNYKSLIMDKVALFLITLLGFSFVMVYPRFSYFHFQLGLAFIVVIFGYLLSKYKYSPVIIAMSCMLTFFVITIPGIKRDMGLPTRFWADSDISLSKKIEYQVEGNSVYLLGLPSSLYVFSDTLPPKPWLDNYGWYFEISGVQSETMSRWDTNSPKFIVWQDPEVGQWYDIGVYQPKEVADWIRQNYVKKELIMKGVSLWQRID